MDDADIVLISALEHYSYCPRQCALIHMEQTYDENIYTLKGHLMHERVHEEDVEQKGDMRIERGLTLWSFKLGIVGKADVVEFHGNIPYPVEYKLGPKRKWGHDNLQLCAQAICLEEMTGKEVKKGAVYHHGSRRRREVEFDEQLRVKVQESVTAIREMLKGKIIPAAPNDARCRHCSLIQSCLPELAESGQRIRHLKEILFKLADE
jgi:CRISPR-associated exonuclease Cas4